MKTELSIKLDYLKDRSNPAEVFEAMASYINAYQDLGQLLSSSIGLDTDFSFQLNDIEKGSILSKLSVISDKIDNLLEAAFYNSGNELFKELIDEESTESEEQVEQLAAKLESSLAQNIPPQMIDPYIDRQNLSFVLSKFSNANQKIRNGESVTFKNGESNRSECKINTSWRFLGNPREMFQGDTKSHETDDRLYVKISVNEGNSVWSFRSTLLNRSFPARILQKEWLERYQAGLIPAIGPKDIIKARNKYDVYTPTKGHGHPEIRNAKIITIDNIERYSGHQYEIDA
ncbi:hypothetical protein I6L35_02205 [Aeromonas sp. FDAARGOS 1405]|uniref:hypothetical protein n=1 Tax=unclassified Aeromonas TaxID=257493 RepID=UPI001C22E088|nr:hypothetical protein [Aeromonas sp. FDAARGOS 1405]QXB30045.1 hypothetical protein I6L35_02205 [Aeromonas sp. FDAARGOS 1405]